MISALKTPEDKAQARLVLATIFAAAMLHGRGSIDSGLSLPLSYRGPEIGREAVILADDILSRVGVK